MRLKVTALPGFRKDIADLPDDEVRKAALEALGHAASGVDRGQPLDTRVSTADLGDCRKIYFDAPGYRGKPRFRLVVRLLPTGAEAVSIEAVSVGERNGLDAYVRAVKNLKR